MAVHLFRAPHPASSERSQLRLLMGYENGGVSLFTYGKAEKERSVEGTGWEKLWSSKLHMESGTAIFLCSLSFGADLLLVMAMAVTRDNRLALTVSADNLIGRYDLAVSGSCAIPHTVPLPHHLLGSQ